MPDRRGRVSATGLDSTEAADTVMKKIDSTLLSETKGGEGGKGAQNFVVIKQPGENIGHAVEELH